MEKPKRAIHVHLPTERIEQLDKLAEVNQRSRPQLVDILVRQAFDEWKQDPRVRIDP